MVFRDSRDDEVRESGSPTKTQGPERFFGNLSDAAASIPMLGWCRRGRRNYARGSQTVSGRGGGLCAFPADHRVGHRAGPRTCCGGPVLGHLSQRRVRPLSIRRQTTARPHPRMRVITAISAAPQLYPRRPAQQSPLTSSRCGRWQFLDPSIAPGTIRLSARLALPEALRFLPDVAPRPSAAHLYRHREIGASHV